MKKVLAVIAHDSKKDEVIQLIKAHNEELADIALITTEAILHLMAEHPEALSGHHLAAQYLEEMVGRHE